MINILTGWNKKVHRQDKSHLVTEPNESAAVNLLSRIYTGLSKIYGSPLIIKTYWPNNLSLVTLRWRCIMGNVFSKGQVLSTQGFFSGSRQRHLQWPVGGATHVCVSKGGLVSYDHGRLLSGQSGGERNPRKWLCARALVLIAQIIHVPTVQSDGRADRYREVLASVFADLRWPWIRPPAGPSHRLLTQCEHTHVAVTPTNTVYGTSTHFFPLLVKKCHIAISMTQRHDDVWHIYVP